MAKLDYGSYNINYGKNVLGQRNKISNVNKNSSVNNDKVFTAGEALTAGTLGYIHTDGKVYKSTALSTDNKPAQFFIFTSAALDENVFIRYNDEITVSVSGTIGNSLYLRTGTPNVGTILTTKSGSEDIQQSVGYYIEANKILIKFGIPLVFG